MWAKPCALMHRHCFIIIQHVGERGRSHPLSIKHHDRKSLECLELCHAWQSSVYVSVCACMYRVQSLWYPYTYVCLCSLWRRTCQSAVPSGSRLPIGKGRRERGAAEGRDWERAHENRRNGWSESHRCLPSFSARLSEAFLLTDHSEAQVWNSPLNARCLSAHDAMLCTCACLYLRGVISISILEFWIGGCRAWAERCIKLIFAIFF